MNKGASMRRIHWDLMHSTDGWIFHSSPAEIKKSRRVMQHKTHCWVSTHLPLPLYTHTYTHVQHMHEWTHSHTPYPSLPCLPDIPSRSLRKRKRICWSEACWSGSWNRMKGRNPAVIHLCVACIWAHTRTHNLTKNTVDKVLKQTLVINLSHALGYWSVVRSTFPRLLFLFFAVRIHSYLKTVNVMVYQLSVLLL